jgi:hypothetical protein
LSADLAGRVSDGRSAALPYRGSLMSVKRHELAFSIGRVGHGKTQD